MASSPSSDRRSRAACKRADMLATLLFSVLMVAAPSSQQQLNEGSSCTLASKPGVLGVCKQLSDCQYAQDERREGRCPDLCSSRCDSDIVCCPPEEGGRTATRPPQSAAATSASVAETAGRIAAQKCKEYSKHVCLCEVSFALLHSVELVEQCASSSEPLVVGGHAAKPKEFPHMALIGYGERDSIVYSCGGSLISPDFVLTAAHCAANKERALARWVLLGDLDRSTDDDVTKTPQVIEVDGLAIRHPDYEEGRNYNDIALLRLKTKAEMNGFVRPACLHTEADIHRPHAIASGWGVVAYGGDTSDHLLKVQLTLQPYEVCNISYREHISPKLRAGIVYDTMLCAGELEGGKDTCQGDSGGPLQIFSDQDPFYCMYHIVGVTSFGKVCGSPNSLGVYTRVSYFVPWIESIVWPQH